MRKHSTRLVEGNAKVLDSLEQNKDTLEKVASGVTIDLF